MRVAALMLPAAALAVAGCGTGSSPAAGPGTSNRLLKLAACMRSHGVPGFPDPNTQGQLAVGGPGDDPDTPVFRAAMQTCRKEVPSGPPPSPQQVAKAKQSALAFSACMRKHGIQDFPDPVFSEDAGTVHFLIGGRGHSDVNGNNPAFQKAQQACGGLFAKLK